MTIFGLTVTWAWLALILIQFGVVSCLAAAGGIFVAGIRTKILGDAKYLYLLPAINQNVECLKDADLQRQADLTELREEVTDVRRKLEAHASLTRHKNGKTQAILAP